MFMRKLDKFLSEYLADIPEEVQDHLIDQLETAIKGIHQNFKMTIHDTTIRDFTLQRMCAMIYSVLELSQGFRDALAGERIKDSDHEDSEPFGF